MQVSIQLLIEYWLGCYYSWCLVPWPEHLNDKGCFLLNWFGTLPFQAFHCNPDQEVGCR